MAAGTVDWEPEASRPSVTDILRAVAPRFVEAFPDQAVPHVQSTLAKLSLCRTAALGGRRYRCDRCVEECVVYNSCGDRNCPCCRGAKRADWLDSAARLILDGVPHYQVVFTLPKELSRLALGNRRAIFNLLFRSAWSALQETIEAEHGYEPAALMVLHTWNQKLESHIHVHAVVPGGGPALDGSGWRWSCRAGDSLPSGRYLVDADRLRATYRRIFLKGLDRLHAADELKLEGEFAELRQPDVWRAFIDSLQGTTWVSYIEAPPVADAHGATVLKYLARYLTGGPISDGRIVSASASEVTILAREGTKSGGDRKQVPVTLSTLEFVRRWCLHILPKGFTKIRYYGGWSSPRRERNVMRCYYLLEEAGAPLAEDALVFGPFDAEPEVGASETSCPECPRCGEPMIPQGVRVKPSWAAVMHSEQRPSWYRPVPGRRKLEPRPPSPLQSTA